GVLGGRRPLTTRSARVVVACPLRAPCALAVARGGGGVVPRVGGGSAAAVGCETAPTREVFQPLLGGAEAELGLLGACRVAVQVVVDDVTGTAVQLVRRERDAHIGAPRPRFRDRDLPLGREALGEPPECLARHVAGAFELDRHAGDHL